MDNQRIEIDLRTYGVAEVPLVGHQQRKAAGKPLGQHRHDEHLELLYLRLGEQTYNIEGIDRFALHGGQGLLTLPGEVHSSADEQLSTGEYYWIQIAPPPQRGSWLGLTTKHAQRLYYSLVAKARRPVRLPAAAQDHFEYLLSIPSTAPSPWHAIHILHLLSIYCEAPSEEDAPRSSLVEATLTWIEAHLDRSIYLPDIADALHVSTSTLTRRFKAECGTTPGDYHLRRRLERARQRLQAGKSVTDVAFGLGFCSTQHFATQYKKVMHARPSQHTPNSQHT